MKNVFFKMMVVGMTSGMFVGCADDIEDLYDPAYAKMKQQYQSQWEQQFGKIDPNHTWGFTSDASEAKAMTRGANTNSNEWANYVTVPEAVSEAEVEAVLAVFNNPIDKSASKQVNWSDFWVQHVYQGSNSYVAEPDQNGHSQTLQNVLLDQLQTAYYNENGELVYEHVNNFNASSGSVMLMQNSGTVGFSFNNPKDSGKPYYDYVIMEVDGEYYVGFDFSCNDVNQTVKADGIYNDWIVKIVPAEYKNAKRIVCEDLGTIGDFDFNDVVFDAYMVNENEAVVTVLAAGGTLPIYVGDVEIHAAMGVETDQMTNTGGNSVVAPVANFRVATTSIKDIPVRVLGNEAAYVLQATEGQAPQKICVPSTFKWCVERANIKDAYPAFEAWSQSEEENAEWYNEVNTEYLK